ncbi:ras-related protein Rab-4B-like, partial [Malurus melanocephalus]|uniref:ras-related protein Rab-4B-like n=1 Tax=Malurus melanocephalus TaxID=175006 RepID=UPI002548F090
MESPPLTTPNYWQTPTRACAPEPEVARYGRRHLCFGHGSNMSETYDFLFKFLVIGSAGTGKSCLLHHFIESKCTGKFGNFGKFAYPGRSVTRSYYRGAAGALLVYDITSRETYNALAQWLTDARTLASPNIVIILCGNKKDLEGEREVTFLEASRFAQENGEKKRE